METVIGIIIIVLSLVFKVVEKKLKDAGKPVDKGGIPPLMPRPAARPVSPKPFAELEDWMPEPASVMEIRETSADAAPAVPAPVAETNVRSRKRGSAQVGQKPKMKPDPKKLVIYSEIMKPKYTEL